MAESICICGQYADGCDRQCAGALAQQAECARDGHLTAARSFERGWKRPAPAGMLADPDFCYRCGHRPARTPKTSQ